MYIYVISTIYSLDAGYEVCTVVQIAGTLVGGAVEGAPTREEQKLSPSLSWIHITIESHD
jgi:hypothetical protein